MNNEYPVLGFTIKQLNDMVIKLGGSEGVKLALDDHLDFSLRRRNVYTELERNGLRLTYVTLPPTDETTGPQWVVRLGSDDFTMDMTTAEVLESDDFTPTKGVVYKVVIVSGDLSFDSTCEFASRLALGNPNAELACMLRENLSDWKINESLGFSQIVVMHEPLQCKAGNKYLLSVQARTVQGRRLGLYKVNESETPESLGSRKLGLAFIATEQKIKDFGI